MSLCVLSNIVAHRLGFSSVEVTLYVEVRMLATCLTLFLINTFFR